MPYYNRDPKRDPNFDNHPFDTGSLDVKGSGDVFVGGSVNGMGPRGLGCKIWEFPKLGDPNIEP